MTRDDPARPVKSFDTDRTLSIGIVGAGRVVREMHLPVLLGTPGVSVEWITDRDDAVARETARDFRIGSVPAPRDATNLPQADLYLLAIPYGAREPFYDALRDRDAALYVEKPFALDVDEHQRICSGFDDWRLCVGLQRRSFGPTALVRDLIAEELFGPLRSVQFAMGRPGGGRYSGFRSNTRQSGGGILAEHGIHLLDSVLFLTGADSVRFDEVKMVCEAGLDVHTDARFTVNRGQRAGVDCRMQLSWLTETDTGVVLDFDRVRISYSIYDEEGRIQVQGPNGRNIWRILPHSGDLFPLTAVQTLYEHWRLFLDGVRGARPNYTAAARSILTTEIIESCYEFGRDSTGPVVEAR